MQMSFQFIEVLRTGQGDFVGSLAALLRQFPRCEGLDEFIVGNGLGPSYLALFKRHCRDGDPQAVRVFLQAVASTAEFEHIDEYLNLQSAAAPITYKLGLGSESSNPGAGELGNKIRNALRLDRDARSRNPQATAQAGRAGFPMRTFHGTPVRGATTNYNDHHFNPGTPGGASYTFNTPGGGFVPNNTPGGRFVPNNFYPAPGTPGGGYASFNNQGHPDHGIPGGFSTVGSHAGSDFYSDAQSWQQQQQLNRPPGLFIDKENHVNAPAPSIPSQVSSVGGEVSSIGGFSNLSINGHKSNGAATKTVNVHEFIELPDFFSDFVEDRFNSSQHISTAKANPFYAAKKNSELLTKLHAAKSLQRAKDLVEREESIYNNEAREFQRHIDDVDRRKKESLSEHDRDVANIVDEEAEAIREVKARFAEQRAFKKNEVARAERNLDAEKKDWEQKKAQSKAEKEENLTQAKARLIAFETGVEIVGWLAQLESQSANPEFLRRLENHIRRLDEFQRFHSSNAVDALKNWVWDDEDL
mmetsp:Transcript_18645/g.37632  ORF Transcript_18645/g.37632 Transcript_18645/m.37632 type:complete len:528 (-) Transcript_18645:1192-2775(-)